jgi:hypothetical protein
MGKRLEWADVDPVWAWAWPTREREHPGRDVGVNYHAIAPELLIEKGDEYLHPNGRFVPFPLEAIGRPVGRGVLARRLSDR